MFTKKIRASIIGDGQSVEQHEYRQRLLRELNIEEYGVVESVDEKEIKFSDNRNSVFFNDREYEYGAYSGTYNIRREYLSSASISFALTNQRAINDQKTGYYTLVLANDVVFLGNAHTWQLYVDNLPAAEDYDIILFTDNVNPATDDTHIKELNDYYCYLPLNWFPRFNIYAYIVNSSLAAALDESLNFRLYFEDYVYCYLNDHKLKVLVAKEALFGKSRGMGSIRNDQNPINVLFYTMIWGMENEMSKMHYNGVELSTDKQTIHDTDVVIFHMPTVVEGDPILCREAKRKGQVWVFWSMECEAHYPWHHSPEIMGLFDVTMTYKLDADIPVPYLYPIYDKQLRRVPVPKTGFINAYTSNSFDQSGRVKFLEEIIQYIEIHSYGKTLNNRSFADGASPLQTRASYKFSLALENAIAKDYVTEKFFHPLIFGTVPVYLGAPNVDEFAPVDHCFINVRDFNSVRELADYLTELDKDDVEYESYLKWKTEPFRDEFKFRINSLLGDPFSRLFSLLRKKFNF